MYRTACLFALALSAGTLGAATMSEPGSGRVPVLLELFTSEGCSSCPPADRLLETLDREQPVSKADLVVVSEHVDYWNHLGWSDPFSSAAFSARQRDYAARLKTGEVYTPQLVVDGQKEFVGSDRSKAFAVIGQSAHDPKIAIAITADRSGTVHVTAPALEPGARKADLFVVLASDRMRSDVKRGENAGESLSHVSVAYSFAKVASWNMSGALDRDFHVDIKPGPTRVIVFLQDPHTARVLGIAHMKI